MRIDQDRVGRCAFLDVLEEAVLVRRPVAVELEEGETFLDEVTDVVTREGQEWIHFRSHPPVLVEDIRAATRACRPPR